MAFPLSSSWPHGIPYDIVNEIVGRTDLQTALALSKLAHRWRSAVFESTHAQLPFRFFTDECLLNGPYKDLPSSSRNALLFRCWDVVKHTGGFVALHLTEPLKIPAETVVQMIEGSAQRLRSLDVYLNPSQLHNHADSRRSSKGQRVRGWDVYTWQGRLDGTLERIMRMCSGLRHFGLECPYERPGDWTETKCYRLILPTAAYELLPFLRSLKVVNLKPEYSKPFFDLAERLESFHVSGDGLDGEDARGFVGEKTHLMSPSALRVLLRYLERGQRIKSLVVEEPFIFSSFGPKSLFDGLEAGLVHRNEIDPRWETRLEAQSAFEEGLWGQHDGSAGVALDLLRDREDVLYVPPRRINLPTLEVLHLCGLDAHDSAYQGRAIKARLAELTAIAAPNLEELYLDSPMPVVAEMFRSDIAYSDGLPALRKLTFRRMIEEDMPVGSVATILESLFLLETLIFDFTYGGGTHYDGVHFQMPHLWPLIDDASGVMPNLRHLVLINDESSSGADIVAFIKRRLKSIKVEGVQGSQPIHCGIQTLSITTTPMYRQMEFTAEERAWLEDNLESFTLDQTAYSETDSTRRWDSWENFILNTPGMN